MDDDIDSQNTNRAPRPLSTSAEGTVELLSSRAQAPDVVLMDVPSSNGTVSPSNAEYDVLRSDQQWAFDIVAWISIKNLAAESHLPCE